MNIEIKKIGICLSNLWFAYWLCYFYRYCKCEMPYNPDDLMVQCEGCKDWYDTFIVKCTSEAFHALTVRRIIVLLMI